MVFFNNTTCIKESEDAFLVFSNHKNCLHNPKQFKTFKTPFKNIKNYTQPY